MRVKTVSSVEIMLGAPISDRHELVDRIRKGLPFSVLVRLQQQLGLSRKQFLTVLAISHSTMLRREIAGKMSVYESEKILRIAQLFDLTLQFVNGSNEDARRWLSTRNMELKGETPLTYAATETGAKIVEDLIAKIELGIVI